MPGMNAETGLVLGGFEHVEQSLEKILTTYQGERVMREWFGNPGLRLLGENATPRTVLMWYTITWMLIELFEPRFRIRRFVVHDIDRIGFADFTMEGEHLPFAHLDWVGANVYVSIDNQSVVVRRAT